MQEVRKEPAWVDVLFRSIVSLVPTIDGNGSFSYNCEEGIEGDTATEILVFPLAVEVSSGSADGDRSAPAFTMNLKGLLSLFSDVDHFEWLPHDLNDLLSPSIDLVGLYQGHRVSLTLLAFPPEEEETRGYIYHLIE